MFTSRIRLMLRVLQMPEILRTIRETGNDICGKLAEMILLDGKLLRQQGLGPGPGGWAQRLGQKWDNSVSTKQVSEFRNLRIESQDEPADYPADLQIALLAIQCCKLKLTFMIGNRRVFGKP